MRTVAGPDMWEDPTVEIFTPAKARSIVAEFAGMRDLSAFSDCPGKLFNLLNEIDSMKRAPDGMEVSLDDLQQAAETVRYFTYAANLRRSGQASGQ